MYAPEGFQSLAELWIWFARRFGGNCRDKAVAFYRNPEHDKPTEIFGSPRDLCEDLFLRALEDAQVTLAAADAKAVDITPVLSGSSARLFEKATPLESFAIAAFPDEAGPENEWLIRMGSRLFVPTGHTDAEVTAWLETYCSDDPAKDRSTDPNAQAFHTLPYLFERGSFIVPTEFPPWTDDMLDDAFLRLLKPAYGGRSMCLSDARAEQWRASLTPSGFDRLLKHHIPAFKRIEGDANKPSKGGRPKLQELVVAGLREMGPDIKGLQREEIRRILEDRLNIKFSLTVLYRALRVVRQDKDKS